VGGRPELPLWMRLIGIVVLLFGTVWFGAEALMLAATSSDECPSVVDTNDGRGVDFECSSSGGQSKDSAVLLLAGLGVMFGAFLLVAVSKLLHDVRSGAGSDDEVGALIDDLAELDDLRARGLLTDDELDAAKTRRLRQD
jgi:hypothetical protein